MPELSLAAETDSGRPLGTQLAVGELPPAVDDSLELVVESDVALAIEASTTYGELPMAVETDAVSFAAGGFVEMGGAGFGTVPFGTASFGTGSGGVLVALPAGMVAEKPAPAATEQDMALPLTILVNDAEFARTIEDIDRTPVFTLKADWGRTGLFDHEFSDLTELVEDVTVDRTLTGELPAEVGLVDGTTSATMSVQLAGRWSRTDDDGLDPVDVFAPYRPDSPLYGAPVLQSQIELETGFVTNTGPRLDRRFTGTVARINPTSSDRTVALTGLDASHRLRESVTLPGTAMYTAILKRRGPDAYRSRMNSQWLIDHVLRRNGIFASPPPRPEAVLSVTGHGSMIPEIGWGGAPQEYYPTYRGPKWAPGRFGPLATVTGDIGRWWLNEQVTAAAGAGIGFSMWLGLYPGDGVYRQYFSVDLTTDASWSLRFGTNTLGFPYLVLHNESTNTNYTADASDGGWAPPASGVWRFVGVHATFAVTSMTVRFRLGGVTVTKTLTIPARASNWKPGLQLNYTWNRSFHNFQMWKSATPPGAGAWQGEDWIPQADLDPGANELTGIPQIVGEDSMELIKQVCAAEGSTFEFTEEGRARFRTRVGDAARGEINDITERVTADRNLADLVSTTDESTVRNVVNVKTQTQLIDDWEDYFEATTVDQFDTPPGTSVFDIPIDPNVYDVPETRDAYGVRSALSGLANASFVFYTSEQDNPLAHSPGWDKSDKLTPIKNYIRLCLVYADNPVELASAEVPTIYIRVERTDFSTLRIYITNYSAQTVRFATPSRQAGDGVWQPGQPALIIPARLVKPGPEQLETYTDNGSVKLYGPSAYDVGSSAERWRQTPEGLRGLATSVLAATAHPVPVLEAVDVPHDPRRRLRDRIVLEDPDGLGEVVATVVGLSTTYSGDGATDRLTVRPIAPPGLGLLGDATVGLLGINFVLS